MLEDVVDGRCVGLAREKVVNLLGDRFPDVVDALKSLGVGLRNLANRREGAKIAG